MKLKMLLSVYAVFLAVVGAGLLIVPSGVFRVYHLVGGDIRPLDELVTSLVQSIGAVAVGLGIMCWTARAAVASRARYALILGLTVVNGLGAVVTVRAAGGNWLMWTEALLFALLTVLFIVIGWMSAPTARTSSSSLPKVN